MLTVHLQGYAKTPTKGSDNVVAKRPYEGKDTGQLMLYVTVNLEYRLVRIEYLGHNRTYMAP